MIQIPKQIERSRTKQAINPKINPDAHPYILRRIFYTFILVALLLAICFYFDLLSDYDLISMILGFIVCIILQFILLSSYFNEEMHQLQTDQIGVIKQKIKMIFGELNPHQVERKARSKYYRREPNEEDRLFDTNNNLIYQNVMTHLRGKSQYNFNEIITKVKGKWLLLENKIKLVENFLANMHKLNESRKLAYLRQKNRIKRIHETQEHCQWAQFMSSRTEKNKNQSINNTSYYSQDSQQFTLKKQETETRTKGKNEFQKQSSQMKFIQNNNKKIFESKDIQGIENNWGYLNMYFLQKIKLIEREVSDLKEIVIQQFQVFAQQVRSSSSVIGRNRQKLLEDYKSSELEKTNNIRELEKTASKIVQLSQGLQAKVERGGGEIELILKRQFQLRLLKIQSQNLLIKLTKAHNCRLLCAEELFKKLQFQNQQVEKYLQTFNQKITQYIQIMAGYYEKRAPDIRELLQKSLTPFLSPELVHETNPEVLYSNILNRRNSEGVFRGHLQQSIKFLEQVEEQNSKITKSLKTWKGQFERKQGDARVQSKVMGDSSGARLLYFASNINDQKLLHMFEQFNETEVRTCKKIRMCLQKELNWMRSFEAEIGAPFSQQLRRSYEQFKRKEQQLRKQKKRTTKDNIQPKDQSTPRQQDIINVRLVQTIRNYSACKINSILPEIITIMIQNEAAYYKITNSINPEQNFEIQNQRTIETDDDSKIQKYSTFANYISRTQGQQIIDDFLLRGDNYNLFDKPESEESRIRYLIDLWRDNEQEQGRGRGSRQNQRMNDFFRYQQSVPKSLDMLNRILSILFNEWCNSEHFHDFVKEELLVSLNRKKPDIVQHLRIDYFRIVQKDRGTPPIKNLKVHNTEIYRCMFDLTLNFKGKIAVKIGSRLKIGKRPALEVKLLIKEFQCPIRICFTPFSIGKSYASLLDRPKISIQYSVGVGNFFLTKIPFFTQFIKTYAVLKLRKKFLWPKRMTLSVPLAFKSTLELAIQQRNNFQKERERLGKKSK